MTEEEINRKFEILYKNQREFSRLSNIDKSNYINHYGYSLNFSHFPLDELFQTRYVTEMNKRIMTDDNYLPEGISTNYWRSKINCQSFYSHITETEDEICDFKFSDNYASLISGFRNDWQNISLSEREFILRLEMFNFEIFKITAEHLGVDINEYRVFTGNVPTK